MLEPIKALISKFSKREEQSLPPQESLLQQEGWIGVDLDGTLAEYASWQGITQIGRPVPLMLKRVRVWIAAGYQIKIMTARAGLPEGVDSVKSWLAKHGLPELEVTNQKDFDMIELWDDRAIQVVPNSGIPVLRMSQNSRPKAPLLPEEKNEETCEVPPR